MSQNKSIITVHSGNILNVPELKLHVGQFIDREFTESIQSTLEDKYGKDLTKLAEDIQNSNESSLDISRGSPFARIAADDLKTMRSSVKVFLKTCDTEYLRESIDYVLKLIDLKSVDSVILKYKSDLDETQEKLVDKLEDLWRVLEEYVNEKKICRIGMSDLLVDEFSQLYNRAKIKPSILQIGVTSCCNSPPGLQEFCKDNEIQLITHNDPSDILPQSSLRDLFKNDNLAFRWAVRYQAHVMCRGVLVSKGYIACASCHS